MVVFLVVCDILICIFLKILHLLVTSLQAIDPITTLVVHKDNFRNLRVLPGINSKRLEKAVQLKLSPLAVHHCHYLCNSKAYDDDKL